MNMNFLAHIKNISRRYEIREMSNKFYNKLNNIYNNTKNKGGNLLYRSSSVKGEEISKLNQKNKSLPAIPRNKKSKYINNIYLFIL